MAVDSGRPGDDVLVAYLDGELDPAERGLLEARLGADAALKARLDALARGERPFADAFDALLDAAPRARLDAMVAGLAGTGERTAAVASPRRRFAALAAAAVVLLAVGAAAGYYAPTVLAALGTGETAAEAHWRTTVADYQTLITAESMEIIADDPAAVGAELAAVGAKLALELSPDKLTLPHVYLKRVQLFEYWDRPLVQIAYLSPDDGPISFCIIAADRPDEGPAFEERDGFNIVYWTKDGRGYLVIGRAPRRALEALAGELAARIG
jgi:anti-sigma factor RsiW